MAEEWNRTLRVLIGVSPGSEAGEPGALLVELCVVDERGASVGRTLARIALAGGGAPGLSLVRQQCTTIADVVFQEVVTAIRAAMDAASPARTEALVHAIKGASARSEEPTQDEFWRAVAEAVGNEPK